MAKELLFGIEARNALKRGVDTLAEAVKTTLGPRGYNVALDRDLADPKVTHDGVSVAREIELEDKFENIGVKLLKAAAVRTNDIAGDGTTTSTIIAQSLVENGLLEIQGKDGTLLSGANAMELRSQIEAASGRVLEELDKLAEPINTKEKMIQIATVSSGDKEIGELVATALDRVGKDGAVTVEAGRTEKTTVEYKEGLELDGGLVSPLFVTNKEKMLAEFEDPIILFAKDKISNLPDFFAFLQSVSKETKPLVIMSDGLSEEVLEMLVINRARGVNLMAVKAPGFGERTEPLLEDAATVTGGTVVKYAEAKLESLGRAKKVIATRDRVTIVGGEGDRGAVESRLKLLKSQTPASEFEKEILAQRISRLSGGVAILYVGANNEIEMKEKKDRVDDALAATKAAVEGGAVPGGETALLRASQVLGDSVAERIVRAACQSPFKVLTEGDGKVAEVLASKVPMGINVLTGELTDLKEAGVIDPVKVTKTALIHAVTVANLILTTKVLSVTKEEKKDKDENSVRL